MINLGVLSLECLLIAKQEEPTFYGLTDLLVKHKYGLSKYSNRVSNGELSLIFT